MKKNCQYCLICMGSLLLLSANSAFSADNDIQLRLNQDIQIQQLQSEQDLKKLQIPNNSQLPNMLINGEVIQVENNIEGVGQALYIAVMQNQWQAVKIYLDRYLKLDGSDQSLALFAQGALNRVQGNTKQAEHEFRQAALLQPQNQIIKLELARLLTELQKNQEAKDLFKQIKQHLSPSTDQTSQNIIKNINSYLEGLDKRDAWQGSIAFGPSYKTNINNSAEYLKKTIWYATDKEGDYLLDKDGNKIPVYETTQGSPEPIDTTAIDYETSLSKRWSLSGNHGILFRGMSYGQIYNQQPDYNELTFNFNAGYNYDNQKNQILVATVFENKYYGHDSLYNAYGLRAEWMRFIGNDKALKLEGEIKDFHYQDYKNQNGIETSVFSTFWKMLPQQWTIFGGLDYVDHNTEEGYMAAYQQEGVRLGLSKNFNAGFNATLFGSYRWRQYDKYTPVLGEKRDDKEQNYNLIVSAPKWQFYGLTPNFSYQYNTNKSNVDWLYSYDKHKFSLKLEYRF